MATGIDLFFWLENGICYWGGDLTTWNGKMKSSNYGNGIEIMKVNFKFFPLLKSNVDGFSFRELTSSARHSLCTGCLKFVLPITVISY